jgi:hemerythrin
VDNEFPPRQCHIDEHAAVMQSVHEVQGLLAQGDATICRELVAQLADWFPKHADQLDSALAHWMTKKRLGGKPVVVRRGLKLR